MRRTSTLSSGKVAAAPQSIWKRLSTPRRISETEDYDLPDTPNDIADKEIDVRGDDFAVDVTVVDYDKGKDEDGSHSDHNKSIPNNAAHPDEESACSTNASRTKYRRLLAHAFRFFDLSFPDPKQEKAYQSFVWRQQKPACLLSILFYWVNFILLVVFLRGKFTTADKISLYALIPVVDLCLPIAVFFDWPRHYSKLWSILLFVCVYTWPAVIMVDMYTCGIYRFPATNTCGRDFAAVFYHCIGPPVIAFTIGNMKRFPMVLGQTMFTAMVGAMVLPYRLSWIKNLLVYMLFSAFIDYFHYFRECEDRKMFIMRAELRTQIRKTTHAQVREREASESKRKFVSYLFHEARSPLGAAMMALANMEAAGVFKQHGDTHSIEYAALKTSLSHMRRVLNDTLDFARMESGHFESHITPFALHHTVTSVARSLKITAAAKNISVDVNLDPAVEIAIKDAFCGTTGEESYDGPAVVEGDELRLRQIITNLTTNAQKFTPRGGSIKLMTELVYSPPSSPTSEKDPIRPVPPLRTHSTAYSIHSATTSLMPKLGRTPTFRSSPSIRPTSPALPSSFVTVRISVEDTGCGIKQEDVKNLFTPYKQTSIGRAQGSGSTGLGLSLVRHLVEISRGRLGVRSVVGAGSLFWIEIPFKASSKEALQALHSTNVYSPINSPEPNSLDVLARRLSVPRRISTTLDPAVPTPSPPRVEIPLPKMPMPKHSKSSSQESAVSPVTPLTPSTFEGLSVLVVDDDTITRQILSRMLQRLGCTVTTAVNGKMALDILSVPVIPSPQGSVLPFMVADEALQEEPFDMVIMDGNMPVLNGIQTVKLLRQARRTDFVCAITGNALQEELNEFLEAGASRVFPKPCLEADLRTCLHEAAERAMLRNNQIHEQLEEEPPDPRNGQV